MAKAIPAVWLECYSSSQMSHLIDSDDDYSYESDLSLIGDVMAGAQCSLLGTDGISSIYSSINDECLTISISAINSKNSDVSCVSAIGE